MPISAYIPTESLRPFVKTYLVVESRGELVNNVLPDTSLVMAFRYKGKLQQVSHQVPGDLPSSSLTGLNKSLRTFNYAADTGNILVIFTETGAGAFFREPLHELFDENVPLRHFIGTQNASLLEEQLAEATDHTRRIAIVETFLMSRLYNLQLDRLISSALHKIAAAKGILKIKHLADSLYISQDAFEKRFRRAVGTTPKQFAYITRMKNIVNSLPQNQPLTRLALDAGYFDQAHFNKDFKLFTGQTPTDFFRAPPFLKINDFLQ